MRHVLDSRALRLFALTQLLLEVQFWLPLWLVFLLDRGFSMTTAVLADGVFRLVVVVCEVPLGLVADRLGRRRTYLACALLNALTFALICLITTTPMLFATWIVWGIAWALTSGAAIAYLYELVEQEHPGADPTSAFSVVRAVSYAAVLLSLLTAGPLYRVDPRLPFALTAALAALAAIGITRLPDVPRSASASVSLGALWSARTVRVTLALGVVLLLFGWSVQILYQPVALSLGLSPEATSLSYALIAACGIAGALAASRIGRRHLALGVAVGLLVVWTSVAAAAVWPRWAPIVWFPVLSLGYAGAWTLLEVLVNRRVAIGARATAFSVISLVAGLGIAGARPGLGWISATRSSPAALAAWAGAGVVLVPLGLWLARRARVD